MPISYSPHNNNSKDVIPFLLDANYFILTIIKLLVVDLRRDKVVPIEIDLKRFYNNWRALKYCLRFVEGL